MIVNQQTEKVVCSAVVVIPGDASVGLFPRTLTISYDEGYFLYEGSDKRSFVDSIKAFALDTEGEEATVYLYDADGNEIWF